MEILAHHIWFTDHRGCEDICSTLFGHLFTHSPVVADTTTESKDIQIRIRSIMIIAAITFLSVSCSKQVSFNKDIKPILVANCLMCHDGSGEGSATSGFTVKTYDSVMKGTKYGAVVIPGSSVSSTLYRLVAHKVDPKIQMPPHHDEGLAKGREDALTASQIEIIGMWIDQGAKNN